MGTSLSRLQSATEIAILGNTEEQQRMTQELQENQEKKTQMFRMHTQKLETVIESQGIIHHDLVEIKKLLRAQNNDSSKKDKPVGQGKLSTPNMVQKYFDVTMSPMCEYSDVKETCTPDTCIWILEEDAWDSWQQDNGKQSSLTIFGPSGAGKSHIAASAYDHLIAAAKLDPEQNTCVTHFYFRETREDFNDFCSAVRWIVIQIAEQDPTILSADCVDELEKRSMENFIRYLHLIQSNPELKISTLCTTRPSILPVLEGFYSTSIAIVKEKQLPDLKALIWHHLTTDSGLRKLSRYMKQTISSTLEEKASGMLYAEHTLRQFNILGRELLVLKRLEMSMPKTLSDLYHNMLEDLQRRIATDQQQLVRSLFCWLAFAYRPMTLDECVALLKLIPGKSLDLEEELQGQLSAAYNDGIHPLKFQERSMRDFFCSTDTNEQSSSLRTPSSEAHCHIFITSQEDSSVAHKCLQKYAVEHWARHLARIKLPVNQLEFLDAVGKLLTNTNNAAAKIEASLEVSELRNYYYSAGWSSLSNEDLLLESLTVCANTIVELAEGHLATETVKWATDVAGDHQVAQKAYKLARDALWKNDAVKFTGSINNIFVVAHLFDDIPIEGNAHWAVGVLLSAFGDHEAVFTLYSGKCSDADLVDMVKQWQPLERLTWMTWGYRGYNIYSDHHHLQEAAARCNEVPFLVMAYEETIRFLDQMDSGAPICFELSMLHYRVCGDLDAAKKILDEILDSKTDGNLYALTNDDPEPILIHAFNFLLGIIYEQFWSTGDRERKAHLLMEVRNLRQHPLVQSIPLGESMLMHQTIILARMTHKMGPATEFHDLLHRILEGLEQEMCILFSAQFSALDFVVEDPRHSLLSAGSTETTPHNEKNSAKVEVPTEEKNLVWTCDGECNVSFTQWAGKSMYKCVTCADIGLCESCFQKRQEYNEDFTRKAGRKYCGVRHKYIKGPIEGWKGISKGVMRIQGSEPVLFRVWLAELKDKKWKEAWDRFWKSD
ncbi:hypothetical protein B0H14DRAFT_2628538 [Mycena olivaceomarginata]|nr:hypothetical protein B0H14DRAFT_2628538 [Mycena olivaceomarginata]